MRSFVKPTLYSVPSIGTKATGFTQAYRNIKCLTDNEGQIQGTFRLFPTAITLRDLFDQMVDFYYSYPMFGTPLENKTMEWYTYGEFGELVKGTSAGLLKQGVKMGDIVGVLSEISVFFPLAQWSIAYMGGVMFPIDPSYNTNIIYQTLYVFKIPILICTIKTFNIISQIYLANPTGKLTKIFLFCDDNEVEHLKDDLMSPLETQLGIPIIALPTLLESKPPNEDIEFPTILATSPCVLNVGAGRCGNLNPSTLSHSNLIAAGAGFSSCGYNFGRDVYLPTMPMCRAFERSMQLAVFAHGGCVSFVDGPIVEAMQIARPTIVSFTGETIKALAEALIEKAQKSNFFVRLFYDCGFSIAAQAKEGKTSISWLVQTLILDSFRERVGGRLKVVFSTCTFLQPRFQHAIRTMLQIPVLQCYGTTETGGVICCQEIDDDSVANVGPPISCCEIRIRDFVESRQRVADNNPGEILVRGPNLFSEYHKNKEFTRNAILEDGWFATGDIGKILPNGSLEITDTIQDWRKRKNSSKK